jgi:hypothetical protein
MSKKKDRSQNRNSQNSQNSWTQPDKHAAPGDTSGTREDPHSDKTIPGSTARSPGKANKQT